MNLNAEQLHIIQKIVVEGPISRQGMQDNIIDHLACVVELELAKGMAFTNALQIAITELAPNGLKEIEYETDILLHPNIIIMKKLTFLSGMLFSIAASFGFIFKILHLPGANELTLIGFVGLAIVFVPFLIIVRLKTWKSNLERTCDGFLIGSILLVSSSIVMKIFHLAGAEDTLLIGLFLFALGFLPLTFFKMYKESMAA